MADDHVSVGKTSVLFSYEPGFLPKTHNPSQDLEPIIVPALPPSRLSSAVDRTLCPVRAVRYYVRKTRQIRANRKRFFIPTLGQQEVSKATISRWIGRAITRAYTRVSGSAAVKFRPKPHEVRAVSTSWAFRSGIPVARVLRAATWKNYNTFSKFYLRSLSEQAGDVLRLGPLVAAGEVVG